MPMPSPQANDPHVPDHPFPIVGIGASAGGLEALELFLGNVPEKSGMAFVIVQHLDPTHKGIMVELLQRSTPLPVVQIRDRMRVQPDHVYVIPPNRDLSILHGVLHLLDPSAPRGLRLPIDFFFRSLADELQDRCIGVILSGMGSDGTLGLRAMKEKAGGVFVQDPASAKFDGMPSSAIEAGLADIVAPVAELPGRIIAYLKHAPFISRTDRPLEEKAQSALEKVFILLRTQTGHDFSLYKKSTVYRRIERRMGLHQIDRITTYVRFLRENPHETELLFKELLIGVTSFFRDPAAWEQLIRKFLPELLAARPGGGLIRAWVPGCSTGEEAYSLAIAFRESIKQVEAAWSFSLQVFATDLDKDAIDKARTAAYPANIAADLSPERLRRFFLKEERGYRVGKEIRETVVFAPQNVIMDPPFTKLDILICRNLLIYLAPELQKKLLPLFHYSLNPGGVLFLGSAETIGTFIDLFTPLDNKARIYRKIDSTIGAGPVEFPSSFFSAVPNAPEPLATQKPIPNLQVLADRMLLSKYTPAAALTSDKGDILYISGRTGKYLEPAAGKANWNIFAMAREGLRYELTAAFQKVLRLRDTVTLTGVQVENNGGVQMVDVTLQPITEPGALQGMVMVVFTDVPVPIVKAVPGKRPRTSVRSARLVELERELEQTRHDLQTTREEMQTSQEELKSSYEELQSTNEELQSTNEELTTSKEEMQSMNEELQTVNNEMQAKVDELSRAANDMKNLFDSTEIATLFLDDALNVRRFSRRTSQIIKLIPGDAGRPITDIASDMVYSGLTEDAQEVLQTLVPIEKTLAASNGRWFLVRIMPYRTLENRIDGVVITFTDITVSKKLEAELRKTQAALEKQIGEQNAELKRVGGRFHEDRNRGRTSKAAGIDGSGENGPSCHEKEK
ncbi:MAG: PAS domain-containing protein [Syntrophaceae bacterium]|nr:PAS domain-containing protein [Syntrophaceae bacterium]